jgi:UDP-N-acetylmuramoyl-tripeptide--D-alanyl-D-alanine ligase
VGVALGESGAHALIAVGGDALHYVDEASARGVEAIFVEDAQSALELARSRIRPGDLVLVKASRGVRAERIVQGLITPDAPWPATIPPPPPKGADP